MDDLGARRDIEERRMNFGGGVVDGYVRVR